MFSLWVFNSVLHIVIIHRAKNWDNYIEKRSQQCKYLFSGCGKCYKNYYKGIYRKDTLILLGQIQKTKTKISIKNVSFTGKIFRKCNTFSCLLK